MKVVGILQARMSSTRLPGKMLLPLAGAPLLQRVIERVQRATRLDAICLTYPVADEPAFMPILETCRARDDYGFATKTIAQSPWHGDEADLVGRYLQAAIETSADVIVRIPCDNPCVEPRYIDEAVQTYIVSDVTFHSNTTKKCSGVFVDGVGGEVFSVSRLKILKENTIGDREFSEHPHRYFNYILPTAGFRLDVNTQDDYDFIANIYEALYPANPQFTITDILAYVNTAKVQI